MQLGSKNFLKAVAPLGTFAMFPTANTFSSRISASICSSVVTVVLSFMATQDLKAWATHFSALWFLQQFCFYSLSTVWNSLVSGDATISHLPMNLFPPFWQGMFPSLETLVCAMRCPNALSAPWWTSPSFTEHSCFKEWSLSYLSIWLRTPKRTECLDESDAC